MITKKNLYTIVFVSLAIASLIAIYYLSRKSECCGSCHIASAHHEANGPEQLSVDENE